MYDFGPNEASIVLGAFGLDCCAGWFAVQHWQLSYMAMYGHWAQKKSFLIGTAWLVFIIGAASEPQLQPIMPLRPWIKNLIPHLDPDVKRSLASSSTSGMVNCKTKTVQKGDKMKVKKVVCMACILRQTVAHRCPSNYY